MNGTSKAKTKPSARIRQTLPSKLVLSVRQPYAQLMVTPHPKNPEYGIKWIENRSWIPDCKPGSIILIHASGTASAFEEYEENGLSIRDCRHGAIIGYATLCGWKRLNLPRFNYAQYHAIEAQWRGHRNRLKDLANVYTAQRPKHNLGDAEQRNGTVHWIFANPVMLDKPITVKGKLRLWRYPE